MAIEFFIEYSTDGKDWVRIPVSELGYVRLPRGYVGNGGEWDALYVRPVSCFECEEEEESE